MVSEKQGNHFRRKVERNIWKAAHGRPREQVDKKFWEQFFKRKRQHKQLDINSIQSQEVRADAQSGGYTGQSESYLSRHVFSLEISVNNIYSIKNSKYRVIILHKVYKHS